MQAERTVRLVNSKGLHARAAAKLAQLAGQYPCDVKVEYRGEEVDAKSILGLLLVAAPCGSEVVLRCIGADAEPALLALTALIEGGFEEDD